MVITLQPRTADTVRIYFEKAGTAEIKKLLPQKAKSLEEALADFEKTQQPGATSFGQTIYADGTYVGDIWCYCIDPAETPNCMVSYCIFDPLYRNRGVATAALRLFLDRIRTQLQIHTVGAFTFSSNAASLRVLEKNGFSTVEEFEEDGIPSKYLQFGN